MKMLNKVFFVEKMAIIDQYTIEHEPIDALDLMERAARVWTDFFLKRWGNYQKIVIIAGNGNNGGDGYVVARLLKQRQKEVKVFCFSGRSTIECETNCLRWMREGGELVEVTDIAAIQVDPQAIIIDALFGSGLNRPVSGLKAQVIQKINK